ncbi:quercetin dioxygenase-like cupin family protein [Acidovorax soli]|uniref:Quercetin dioxygenase-like cupin family protein n=1 Tax=Acidovorax soli TaxID=592050 RepID=A0A7X0P8Y8_9BURK|nr:cupin domain-containing protein [Acidovorax soli]MBB6557493.1 quercetin dioxygenase-like cupin family protein [Acidovorax soli]
MKQLASAVTALSFAASVIAQADQGLRITRNGSQPSAFGPNQNFTGRVRVDITFSADSPGRVAGALVTFEPGARTAWHAHPLGQTLIVMQGVGLVQRWGGPVQEIRPGDVVWIPPHQKHWHGATPGIAMSHVAISERLEGNAVEWMEKVSEAQYSNLRAMLANEPR